MTKILVRFILSDSGATAIEYGLIGMFLGVGLIVAFSTFGSSLVGLFGFVSDRAGNAMGTPTP
ncbi:MAG TPA: Flp family type IVb pilin [Devosia sp.]|nr:Flp family type IVb pilin [Devosia sp.]